MNPNDIANMLDGWTRLRVNMLDPETDTYNTIFDSDDHPGWVGEINSCVNPLIEVDELEVTEICIEDNHIVLNCEKF